MGIIKLKRIYQMARGVTTEWNDIQEKMGGYTKLEREPNAEEEWEHNVSLMDLYDRRDNLTLKQLD